MSRPGSISRLDDPRPARLLGGGGGGHGGPEPTPAAPPAWRRWLGGLIGARRSVVVDGVRYRQKRSRREARDVRVYEVRFPARGGEDPPAPMQVRLSPHRVYGDLGPSPRLGAYRLIAPTVRPGMRVLEIGCGSGEGASELGRLAGPTGGVVALDQDRESIRFARRRYRSGNIGFEIGGVETLAGELDGAFDAVIVTLWHRPRELSAELAGELWRVLSHGGMLAVNADDAGGVPARRVLVRGLGLTAEHLRIVQTHKSPGRVVLVATKPAKNRDDL